MRKVIIVAADDDDVRSQLELALGDLGYEVVSAASGPAALEIAERRRFDAVFTDIMMPGMTGYELAAELRKLTPATPIVCSTGYVNIADDQNWCEAFLRKPYRTYDLARVLQEVIGL